MPNQFMVSLWGDEAFSAILSAKPIPEIVKIIIKDTSPPLYNITEHFWFGLFGNSEVAIRALSFLYFLVAVFFVFKIGSHLWDKKTGLVAAGLTFLNPFFFKYAFEGRMYSLLAATVTASFYFFLTKKNLGHIIATTAALYTHHFAFFALLVQGVWWILTFLGKERPAAKKQFKSFVLIGLLYTPWIIPLYNQTKMVAGGFWLGKPTLTDLASLMARYLAWGIEHQLAPLAFSLALVTLLLRKWTKDFGKNLFLLSWFAIPILVAWVLSQKFQSIFFDRYLLYSIPPAMLILSSNSRKFFFPLIGLVLALFAIIDLFYFTHPTKMPFRDLANFVKETKHGDDYLVNWNAAAHHLWEAKYYQIPAPLFVPEEKKLPFYVGTALMEPGDIISKIPTKPKVTRVGVITSGDVSQVKIPGYTKGEEKKFGNLIFVWFDKGI